LQFQKKHLCPQIGGEGFTIYWYGYNGLGCVGHDVGHPNINEKPYQLHFDRVQGMLIIIFHVRPKVNLFVKI
jgi:hypothetical protein